MTLHITAEQLDGLTEVINIGVGRAAHSLNQMLESRIDLSVPLVSVLQSTELEENIPELGDEISSVYITFEGALAGKAAFVLDVHDAVRLVAALAGEPPNTPELDAVMTDTLNEIGNILINGVMGSITDLLKTRVDFVVPGYARGSVRNVLKLFKLRSNEMVIFAKTAFKVRKFEIEGNVFLLFQMASFNHLLSAIDQLYTEG